MREHISVKGARTNNLKNLDVDIPRDKLTVVTGVSGSGKTSLAFDVIFSEGQRKFFESMSATSRTMLPMLERADVDSILGLSPVVAIQQRTEWIITLSGGTVHKPPPLNQEGSPIFESHKAAEFLMASGMDPKRILTEISSYDTIWNAYFARILFSDPHLPRTEAIFRWVYSLTPTRIENELSFESAPNIGLSAPALKARRTRENLSLENLDHNSQTIKSLAVFQRWLYTEHAAYSVSGLKEQLTEDELSSY